MLRDDRGDGKRRPVAARNVLGEPLEICSIKPITGFYRDGCCNTGQEDVGSHTVCARRESGANQRSGGKAGWWRKPAASREVRPKGSALKGNRGLTIGRKSGEAAIGGTRGWIAQQTEAWRKRRKPEVSSRSLSGEIEQPAQAGGETNRDNRQSWHQAQAKGRKSRGK